MSAKKDLPWWKEWWRFFRPLVLIYFAVLAVVYFAQRLMLYHPPDGPLPKPAEVQLAAMQAVTVTTPDGYKIKAWYAPPDDESLPVVLVFHGNGGSIAHRGHIATTMMNEGYGVFLSEYRGYAGNPGSPSEQGLYNDGRGAVAWLKEKGYGPERMVVYGESLGSGVAVQMATEIQPKYLIIQSGFNSALDVALKTYSMFPARLLMKDKFENKAKIAKVKSDLLVIHGDMDTLIPISFAQDLFGAANEPKTFMTVKGAGHNSTYNFGAGKMIAAWLNARVKKEAGDGE